jgi:protein involved in ribonucleotide reduction
MVCTKIRHTLYMCQLVGIIKTQCFMVPFLSEFEMLGTERVKLFPTSDVNHVNFKLQTCKLIP